MSERKRHEWYLSEPGNYLCRHCGARASEKGAMLEVDGQQCTWPNVYQAIAVERDFQEHKWGDNPHTVGEWLLIMQADWTRRSKHGLRIMGTMPHWKRYFRSFP